MLKNCSVTIYEAKTYERWVAKDAYRYDTRGRSVTAHGVTVDNAVSVYLYCDRCPAAGSLIVCGECDFTFDTSTPQTVSESMAAFRATYPSAAVIHSVSDCRFGGLPHIEITAR